MTTAPPFTPISNPAGRPCTCTFRGTRSGAIAELLATRRTVGTWKSRDGWDDIKPIDRVDFAIEARMCQLIAKEVKAAATSRD